jgi:hypothetical protein
MGQKNISMESKEDKAKKLQEIQDRLAEIQSKSVKKPEPKKMESAAKEKTIIPEPPKIKPEAAPEEITSSPVKESAPPPASEPKPTEQPWAGNKPIAPVTKENKPKKSAPASKPPRQQGSSKARIIPIISFIVTLLVIGYFGFTYFTEGSSTTEITATETNQERPMTETQAPAPAPTENVATEVENNNQRELNQSETIEKATAADPKPTVPVVKSDGSEKRDIPKGFIISYASNGSKEAAEKNVAMLKNQGLKANYYWMPDQQKSNPQLYKVYVGPYNSESSAFPDFKKVIKLNDKAFIFRMN